jgi:hypothetical protein
MNFMVIFFGAWVLIMTIWMGGTQMMEIYYAQERLMLLKQEAAAKQAKLDSCGGK